MGQEEKEAASAKRMGGEKKGPAKENLGGVAKRPVLCCAVLGCAVL